MAIGTPSLWSRGDIVSRNDIQKWFDHFVALSDIEIQDGILKINMILYFV